jgi:hypothetical protein
MPIRENVKKNTTSKILPGLSIASLAVALIIKRIFLYGHHFCSGYRCIVLP